MQSQRLVVALNRDDYVALERRALHNDRDPWQEARNIVRAALKTSTPAACEERERKRA